MDYNKLIDELLIKRGLETQEARVQFLHPTLDAFHNPFLLNNMDRAVERINIAVKNKEKIVIYGDYDCDGISAVSILYLHFLSLGVEAVGFIPSRHTDGYGLSAQTVKKIKEEINPSLVITVDTGISAYKEIELFKSLGVDTIVTDHHEPPEKLPETIVIDPKIGGQKYPFNGLSGAGVAFKLVQALSGLEAALNYVDIACISTVGDIVPLLNENRMIVKLGLEHINSKKPRPSIAFLKSKLKIKTLNSTDIAFKIVPRINACGRISTAEKCFKFMVSTLGHELETFYNQIEADNNLRLEMSAEIFDDIDETLKEIDLNAEPAIFIRNDSYNLGLIGIIASKLVGQLNRPVFIFTSAEDGTLKASVRSIEGIDIFQILDKNRGFMVDVGGHAQAGGLTIYPQNYEILKENVLKELQKVDKNLFKNKQIETFDAEIQPSDINMKLASKLEELEPFGFANPRPVFKINTNSTVYTSLKSPKHFKIGLDNNIEVVSFFGERYVPAFLTPARKELIVTLEVDNYFARPRAKAMLKHLGIKLYGFKDEQDYHLAKEIYYFAKCPTFQNVRHIEENYNMYGTIIITDNLKQAQKESEMHGYSVSLEPSPTGESVVLYNPHREINVKELSVYKTIIVKNSYNLANYLACLGLPVINHSTKENVSLNLSREEFKNGYCLITKRLPLQANNYFELVELLQQKTNLPPAVISVLLLVSEELGFYKLSMKDDILHITATPTKTKKNLEESIVYNNFK